MECDLAGEMLNAQLDRQLPTYEEAALEAHLATCADCRQLADALRVQDADLLRAFQPRREAARRVAEAVLRELQPKSASNLPAFIPHWLSLLLACAAGFLLAVTLLQPWKQPAAVPFQQSRDNSPPIATLVAATGKIDLRSGQGEWQLGVPDSDIRSFLCPSHSAVRTGPAVTCELKTTDGCVVRLDQDSEITLTSANTVAIRRGQIWCSSPDKVTLKVVADDVQALLLFSCPSSSCVTATRREGEILVAASQGQAEIQAASGKQRLEPGESVSIMAGQISKVQSPDDPLLATGWVHALLVRKGLDNPELDDRVNQLLARVGQSKVSLLYEQEIRSLGEYATLPLLKYVQSDLSQADSSRRQTALKILADLAPSWMLGELIGLLSSADADTRYHAAHALQRLTGQNFGRTPDQWRESPSECAPTVETWQAWWQSNREQYPARSRGPTT